MCCPGLALALALIVSTSVPHLYNGVIQTVSGDPQGLSEPIHGPGAGMVENAAEWPALISHVPRAKPRAAPCAKPGCSRGHRPTSESPIHLP